MLRPLPPRPDHLATLNHLRQISNLWDRALAVPGTRFRVGFESLLGLLPIGGDMIGILLSSYILIRAAQLGLPAVILTRMLFNLLLDGIVGSVPILGDLFDTTWKANTRNVNLLETHLQSPHPTQRTNRWVLLGLLGVLLVTIATVITLLLWLFHVLSQWAGINS